MGPKQPVIDIDTTDPDNTQLRLSNPLIIKEHSDKGHQNITVKVVQGELV